MSFQDAKNVTPTEKVEGQSESPAIPESDSQLANPASAPMEFEGDWNARDVATPLLQILQPNSNLVEEFPTNIGDFLYDKTFSLGTEMKVIFTTLAKKYQEVKEFDENMPQTFDSLDEAKAAAVPVKEMCIATLAIEVPKDHEHADLAMIEVGDKAYFVGKWYLNGRAFSLARTINKDYMSSFGGGHLYSRFYNVTSVKKPARGKPFRVPVPKLSDPVPEEVIKAFQEKGFVA